MKLLHVLPLMFIAFPMCVTAQAPEKKTLTLSLGAEGLLPDKTLNATHAPGAGITVKGEYIFGEHAAVLATTGFYFLPGDQNFQNLQVIPIKTGVRYYLGSVYAQAEGGAAVFSGFLRSTKFLYSFGIGDKIPIGLHSLDVSIRHEGWAGDGLSIAALRVAFEF